ncbi:hypothetical protein BJ546DRAFT_1065372 [Cryomyces antarcticus]
MASIPVFLCFGGSPEPQPPLEAYIIHVEGGEALPSLSEKVKQTFRERAIYPVQNDRVMSLLAVWNVYGSPAPLRTWLADDDMTFSVILKFFIRREADDILYAQMEDLVCPPQFPDPVAVPRHLVLPSNGPAAFQDLMQHIAQRDENPPPTYVLSNQFDQLFEDLGELSETGLSRRPGALLDAPSQQHSSSAAPVAGARPRGQEQPGSAEAQADGPHPLGAAAAGRQQRGSGPSQTPAAPALSSQSQQAGAHDFGRGRSGAAQGTRRSKRRKMASVEDGEKESDEGEGEGEKRLRNNK